MKRSNLTKFVGATALAVSLAVVPLTVQAQTNTTTDTQTNSTVDARGPIAKNTERDQNHVGWFGLLGLAGLFGLAGKKRRETVRHIETDPSVGTRSTTDYQ